MTFGAPMDFIRKAGSKAKSSQEMRTLVRDRNSKDHRNQGTYQLTVGEERWPRGHQVHVRPRGHQVLRGSAGEEGISPPFLQHRQATTVVDDRMGHRAGKSVTEDFYGLMH